MYAVLCAYGISAYICTIVILHLCVSYRSADYGQTFVDESSSLPVGSLLHNTIYRFPNSKIVSLDSCACYTI